MGLAREAVVFYGARGYAMAIRDVVEHGLGSNPLCEIVAYIDDFVGDREPTINGSPVITFETWRERFRHVPCFVAVSDPSARRQLAEKIATAGGCFRSLYRIAGTISPHISVGEGTFIAAPVYIGPLTTIGKHGQILPMTSVGHDCRLGDYVTVCPSVTISGYVTLEDDVFVGAGATIVNGTEARPLRIGRGAKIFAGAVVMKSMQPGTKVAGNPARTIRSFLARPKW